MRKQYDFSVGVRGKHAGRAKRGSNIVVLDQDIAKRFRTSQQVNRALRALLRSPIGRRSSRNKA